MDYPIGLKYRRDGSVNTTETRQYVTNIDEFLDKWGTEGPGLIIGEYVRRSPTFEGSAELAKMLGELLADLQVSLKAL